MKPVKTIEYPGSVAHFKAFMDRFLLSLKFGAWVNIEDENIPKIYFISDNDELQTSERKIWSISSGALSKRYAAILATQTRPEKITIDFIDGVSYEGSQFMRDHVEKLNTPKVVIEDQIGDDFLILTKEIISKWENKNENMAEDKKREAWEQIPNIGWYRDALRLWHERLTTAEIARKLGKSEQTIRNKIAELRKLYGEDIVPKRR